MIESIPQRSKTRNAYLREKTEVLMTWCASGIYHGIERLTKGKVKIGPDALTVGPFIGVVAVAERAVALNKTKSVEESIGERSALGTAFTLLTVGDGLDGALNRYLNRIIKGRKSSWYGAYLDVVADRGQEDIMALSRARSAYYKGDRIGEFLAYCAAVTNPLSSIMRAYGEGFKDRVSAENGKNVVEFFSTRPGKAILGGVGALAPVWRGFRIQNSTDAAQVGANLAGAYGKLKDIFGPGEAAELSKEERLESRKRFVLLLAVEAAIIKSVHHTYKDLRKKAA